MSCGSPASRSSTPALQANARADPAWPVTRVGARRPSPRLAICRIPSGAGARMQKKMAQEECERFEEDKPLLLRLRRQCLRFVRDNTEAIATARPELPKELGDRTVQIWEPLVVLADRAGGDWPRWARRGRRWAERERRSEQSD